MRIVFNDLSTRYLFRDKYEAMENIKIGLETLAKLRLLNPSFKLWSQGAISYAQLATGYYFNQIFHESNDVFEQKYKVLFRTILKNFNAIKEDAGIFEFEGEVSTQCAWAYRNQNVVFSFSSREEFQQSDFEGQYFQDEMQPCKAKLYNISNQEHIELYKKILKIRKYEFNPKHKINCGWGSDMDLTDEEAQKVLNLAVEAGDENKHLVAKYNGKYYSFRCHYDNCYHGYIDESMPENIKGKADQSIQ